MSRYDGLVHDALSALDLDRARQIAVTWDDLRAATPALGPNSLVGISSVPKYHFRMFRIGFWQLSVYDAASNKAALAEAREILEDLVEGDDGTLEGLDVVLPNHGRQRYVDLLAEMIPGLVGLTQLNVDDEDPFVDFDFWTESAVKLAVAGGRLRYIGRPVDFVEVVRGGKGTAPLFENMGMLEVDDVELFALKRAASGFVFLDRTDL